MGKTVMITGAGSGFGKGAALALAGRGHSVIATTETEEQAAALRAEAPELTVEKLDITTDDVSAAAAWDLDVLINNAGAGQTGPLADVPIDRVRRLFDVNVFGTLAVTQAVLPRMVARGDGRIIIMSSISGVQSAPALLMRTSTSQLRTLATSLVVMSTRSTCSWGASAARATACSSVSVVAITWCPRSARARAANLPKPDPAPVIRTVLLIGRTLGDEG